MVNPTSAELETALLALPPKDYDTLIGKVTTERRRRMYAALEATRMPGYIAHHERHEARHMPLTPFCREFEDGMDGYVVHARTCPNWPRSWLSNDGCIDMTRVR